MRRVRWGPAPPKMHSALQFSAHIHCGQTAGWIKMPLGTEVGCCPGDFVLDGVQLSPKREWSPNFRSMSIVAKRSPISATGELLLGNVKSLSAVLS